MANELTAWLQLPGDVKVRVKVSAFEEPRLPTPNEPEIARVPKIMEWPVIVGKMARLDFTSLEAFE